LKTLAKSQDSFGSSASNATIPNSNAIPSPNATRHRRVALGRNPGDAAWPVHAFANHAIGFVSQSLIGHELLSR
jgi:hypothetical protein